jgi:cell division protein FtsA
VPRSLLTGIIQPRIEEIFELVRARLEDSGLQQIAGRRVVLTGGASQLPNLPELGQLVLDKQIRLGRPVTMKGLAESTSGPGFSTVTGLLHYSAFHAEEQQFRSERFLPAISGNIIEKVTHWLKENW